MGVGIIALLIFVAIIFPITFIVFKMLGIKIKHWSDIWQHPYELLVIVGVSAIIYVFLSLVIYNMYLSSRYGGIDAG